MVQVRFDRIPLGSIVTLVTALIVVSLVFFFLQQQRARGTCPLQQQASSTVNTTRLQIKSNNSRGFETPCVKGSDWRFSILLALLHQRLQVAGDVYEFGVYNGHSMRILRDFFPELRMWGFDSFQGLPHEAVDFKQKDFTKGKYAAGVSPQRLTNVLGGKSLVGFVVGFYNESLTMSLPAERGMSQAVYIDIDADLYTSSLQALHWMFKSGLVRPGTLIGYDDWWVNPCSRGGEKLHPLSTSEGRAHNEIANAYRVRFRCAANSCRFRKSNAKDACDWGPIFVVDALGGDTIPQHGFEMSGKDIDKWKRKNFVCQRTHQRDYHQVYTTP
jgi:hypothetical protein